MEENNTTENAYIGTTSMNKYVFFCMDKQAMIKNQSGKNRWDQGGVRGQDEMEETRSWMAYHIIGKRGGQQPENLLW